MIKYKSFRGNIIIIYGGKSGKTNHTFKVVLTQMVKDNKEIKNYITKLTNDFGIQEQGKFPYLPKSNPKG